MKGKLNWQWLKNNKQNKISKPLIVLCSILIERLDDARQGETAAT